MLNGKSFAILAACAAVAVGSFVQAESVSASDQLTLSRPVAMQAAPADKPLTQGLDQVGLAKPLKDAGITIGGYAEAAVTYYPDTNGAKGQAGRSFDFEDQDPTYNLSIFVERTVDVTKGKFDLGGRLEWIYGGDARLIHSTGLFDNNSVTDGPDEQFDPVQAYIDAAIPVGNGLKLRLGKFVTPAGYETINPTTTPLYSRGLLFTYLLPFTHTGAVATYALNDQWSFDVGVIRGWDDALEDKNSDGVSFLGRVTYNFADKKSSLYTLLLSGPETAGDNTTNQTLLDLVYTYKYSDQWSFAVEGDVLWKTDVDDKFGDSKDDGFAGGLGGWASYTFSQYVTVNGRLEYLYDGQGFRFSGEANNVYSAALGLTVTPFPTDNIGSNLKIRPELRYDYAQNAAFGGDNNQLSFGLEGYFTF